MSLFANLPVAGSIVIIVIAVLFVFAVIMLLMSYFKYRRLAGRINLASSTSDDPFLTEIRDAYAAAYHDYGENTNTPAIISSVFAERLHNSFLAERFLNASVSAFVTLGLFGTFLGLSLSVSSLTDLISLSSSEEWLSILNSVGGGLVSALSGMGVAFYTSLVGVACAIIFTLLRTVFNPQAQRERLEVRLELWLDHTVAPTLDTVYAADDAERLLSLRDDIRAYTNTVADSLALCTRNMQQVLSTTTDSLGNMIEASKEPLTVLFDTVSTFNDNVRDFSTINYDLRGSLERMDMCIRDLSSALARAPREMNDHGQGGNKA